MTGEQTPEAQSSGPSCSVVGLIVLATCAVVVLALIVPFMHYAREEARRMQCSGNLCQLALMVRNYEDVYKCVPNSFSRSTQLSWTVAVLPFLDASPLYMLISQNAGPYYETGKNDPHGLKNVYAYRCPSSPIDAMETKPPSHVSLLDLVPINTGAAPFTLHYYGISGAVGPLPDGSGEFKLASPLTFEDAPVAGNGIFRWNEPVQFSDVKDGLASTMLIGEMSWSSPKYGTRYRSWLHGGTDGSYVAGCRNITRPINSHRKQSVLKPFSNMPMGSQHSRGANFAFADGSVKLLSEPIDMQVYQAMADISGQPIKD